VSGAFANHLPAGDAIIRTQPEPGREVRLGLPARHIHADFADDGLSHADIDAVDPGQVDAADAVQFTAQVKLRGMASRFSSPLGPRAQPLSRCRWRRLAIGGRVGHLVGDALQMSFQLRVAFDDPLQVCVKVDGLGADENDGIPLLANGVKTTGLWEDHECEKGQRS
jgi:hypothetical protein